MPTIVPSIDDMDEIGRKLDDFPLHLFYFIQSDMQKHHHPFIELVYVAKGSGKHLHENSTYPIRAGDCFVVVPGESHGYENQKNLQIVNIIFRPKLLEPSIEELLAIPGFEEFVALEPIFRTETGFKHKLHLSASQQSITTPLIDAIITEQNSLNPGSKPIRRGLFLQLVVQLSRYFSTSARGTNTRHEFNAKTDIVGNAVEYLEHNFDTKLTVNEIASHVCLSVSHLSHVFKETTGTALVDYLTSVRMDHASALLTQTKKSITDISYEIGFHDPAYFSRAFKKRFGVSPAQFRRSA